MQGVDYIGLGSKHWPIERSLKLTPAGIAVGFFAHLFGRNYIEHIERHLDNGAPAARAHCWFAYNHVIVPLPVLKKKLPDLEALARNFPKKKIFVSHSCEYRESKRRKVARRIRMLEKLAPSCIPVNNPLPGSVILPNVITERHGNVSDKHCDIASLDGLDIWDVSVRTWLKNTAECNISFLWRHAFNLKDYKQANAPKPRRRRRKPSKEEFMEVMRYLG